MFLEKDIFHRWCAPLLASLVCIIATLPAWAEDAPAASPAPSTTANTSGTDAASNTPASSSATSTSTEVASNAPGFSNHNPGVGLRPPVSTDGMTTPLVPSDPTKAATPLPPAGPSQNVTINLINLMVKRGLISKDDAANLIKQAQEEADAAQAQAAATQATAERALTTQAQPAPAPAPAPSGDDEVRVTYVPDVVKNQIRDEVTQTVEKQAHDEHWDDKDTTPDWVKRFHVTGDIRTRYQGDFYPNDNSVGSFLNFNSINTSSAYNIHGAAAFPTYNVDQDRERFRLRARIGADIELGQGFSAGIRVASGSDDNPVSENQTLGGVTSGQGGEFSKYQIWLDRAFLKYEWGATPQKDFSLSAGRFDNPFFSTSMIWADDFALDGFMARGKYEVTPGVTPFITAGAFPVFNTDLNFGTASTSAGQAFKSEDKWLYAAQIGTNWKISDDFNFKGAVAYYDFDDVQGKLSDVIDQGLFTSNPGLQGNTDDSRPSFAQHGNTYFAIRDIVPISDPGTTGSDAAYEYYGLASPFRELAVTGQLDYAGFDPFHISLIGEYVNNLAFNRNAIINSGPAIDPGPLNNNNGSSYAGGNNGYDLRLNLGKVALQQLWDWNLSLTYRYVESDATVDAFTDSDFGGALAGTNLQGYIIGANLALTPRVYAGLKWMSTESIAGPAYNNDLIQVDLNAKF